MALWSEVPTGEPTRTPTASGTSVSTKSSIYPLMCVNSETICSESNNATKSCSALPCKFVVKYLSHYWWWASVLPTNSQKCYPIDLDSGTGRTHRNYDCYYKFWQLWLHNIHTHICAVYMPKSHHARIQPTLETDQPHPWAAASVCQNLKL